METTVSVDVGPVHVRGALRARHARMVWNDGVLFVVSRANGKVTRQTANTSEPVPPKTRDGYWRALTDEGQSISATRRGCGG